MGSLVLDPRIVVSNVKICQRATSTMSIHQELLASVPDLLSISDSIKIVEVAKKYNRPNVSGVIRCLADQQNELNTRVPEYTPPQTSTKYHCSKGKSVDEHDEI